MRKLKPFGRPSLGHDAVITIKLPPAQKKLFTQAAKRNDQSLSAFMRTAAREKAEKIPA